MSFRPVNGKIGEKELENFGFDTDNESNESDEESVPLEDSSEDESDEESVSSEDKTEKTRGLPEEVIPVVMQNGVYEIDNEGEEDSEDEEGLDPVIIEKNKGEEDSEDEEGLDPVIIDKNKIEEDITLLEWRIFFLGWHAIVSEQSALKVASLNKLVGLLKSHIASDQPVTPKASGLIDFLISSMRSLWGQKLAEVGNKLAGHESHVVDVQTEFKMWKAALPEAAGFFAAGSKHDKTDQLVDKIEQDLGFTSNLIKC